MQKSPLMILVLVLVALVGASATASAQLGQFVQSSGAAVIQDTDECATKVIYKVPPGKQLRIDWMSIETAEFGGNDYDPVDVEITTRVGGVTVTHPLVRIEDPVFVGTSFFGTQLWSSEVTLYAQGGTNVKVRACRNSLIEYTSVLVSLSGRLFDDP